MYCLFRSTQFTFHFTTPVECARTPLHYNNFLRPITPAATHEITSVHPYRCIVTLAAMRPLDTQPWILLTESRRRFQIHKIFGTRWFMVRIIWFQLKLIPKPNNNFIFSINTEFKLNFLLMIKYVPIVFFLVTLSSPYRITRYTIRTWWHIIRLL